MIAFNFLLWNLACLGLIRAACFGNITSSEFEVLRSLFFNAGGSQWAWNAKLSNSTRWAFPSSLADPCSTPWQGVVCSKSGLSCIISSLGLSNFRMAGQLPSALCNLSDIQTIYFNNNILTGNFQFSFTLL